MNKHKEIVKVLKATFGHYYNVPNKKYYSKVATAIEKIYDLQYLDGEEVEEAIVNYKDYLLTYLGFKLEDHPGSGKIFWGEYNKVISTILKLAIPECKKCKELESDIDTLKSIHYQKEIADEAVIDDLKAEVKELEGTNRMWKDEIERLKDVISRGETILENAYDDLEIRNTNRKE